MGERHIATAVRAWNFGADIAKPADSLCVGEQAIGSWDRCASKMCEPIACKTRRSVHAICKSIGDYSPVVAKDLQIFVRLERSDRKAITGWAAHRHRTLHRSLRKLAFQPGLPQARYLQEFASFPLVEIPQSAHCACCAPVNHEVLGSDLDVAAWTLHKKPRIPAQGTFAYPKVQEVQDQTSFAVEQPAWQPNSGKWRVEPHLGRGTLMIAD